MHIYFLGPSASPGLCSGALERLTVSSRDPRDPSWSGGEKEAGCGGRSGLGVLEEKAWNKAAKVALDALGFLVLACLKKCLPRVYFMLSTSLGA